MARTRIPIPAGAGLDRATGLLVVDPRRGADLRDLLFQDGKVEVRPGMGAAIVTIEANSVVCHQVGFRTKAKLISITFNPTTRAVKIWTSDLNGLGPTAVATWGTLANGAIEPPRFSAAEVYGYLVLAHDEPSVSKRLVTKTYDGTTLANLTANLDNTSAKDVFFRGVTEWGNYLAGWGFGTDSDKDRPEVVRVSKADDPRVFLPGHYFQIGVRAEAIVSCRPCVAGLMVLKTSRRALITGTNKTNFDFVPTDDSFGVGAQRLALTVGDYVYSWTSQGPKASAGAAYAPLEVPLELRMVLPSGLPTGSLLQDGHAAHLPDRDVLLFCFPDYGANSTLVFALSRRNGPLEADWSYWVLPRAVASIAVLAPTAEETIVEPGYASSVSHSGVQQYSQYLTKVTFTHNAYIGDETVEVWGRQGAAAYTLLNSTPINTAAATQSIQFAVAAGGSWDFAVRYTRSGQSRTDHAGTDPTGWPAGCKATGTVTALPALTPNAPTYTPASTIAASTWGASWNTPVTGADVVVEAETNDSVTGGEGAINRGIVVTTAANATSAAGLAAGATYSGKDVRYRLTQRLTVNGIQGLSPLSAWSTQVFFGLNEQPAERLPTFTAPNYKVPVSPGTNITVNWANSASVASASAGTTEFRSYIDDYGASLLRRENSVAIPATSGQLGANNTACGCNIRGVGTQLRWYIAQVRHLLTIAGVQQYTRWKDLSGTATGICQL